MNSANGGEHAVLVAQHAAGVDNGERSGRRRCRGRPLPGRGRCLRGRESYSSSQHASGVSIGQGSLYHICFSRELSAFIVGFCVCVCEQ